MVGHARLDTAGWPEYVPWFGGVGGQHLHSPEGVMSCSPNFNQGKHRTHGVSALLLVFLFGGNTDAQTRTAGRMPNCEGVVREALYGLTQGWCVEFNC